MCHKCFCPHCEIQSSCVSCGQYVCDSCYAEHQENYKHKKNIHEPCCGESESDESDDDSEDDDTVEYAVPDEEERSSHNIQYPVVHTVSDDISENHD